MRVKSKLKVILRPLGRSNFRGISNPSSLNLRSGIANPSSSRNPIRNGIRMFSGNALRSWSAADSVDGATESVEEKPRSGVLVCGQNTEYRNDYDDTMHLKRLKVRDITSKFDRNSFDPFSGWDPGDKAVKIGERIGADENPTQDTNLLNTFQNLNPFASKGSDLVTLNADGTTTSVSSGTGAAIPTELVNLRKSRAKPLELPLEGVEIYNNAEETREFESVVKRLPVQFVFSTVLANVGLGLGLMSCNLSPFIYPVAYGGLAFYTWVATRSLKRICGLQAFRQLKCVQVFPIIDEIAREERKNEGKKNKVDEATAEKQKNDETGKRVDSDKESKALSTVDSEKESVSFFNADGSVADGAVYDGSEAVAAEAENVFTSSKKREFTDEELEILEGDSTMEERFDATKAVRVVLRSVNWQTEAILVGKDHPLIRDIISEHNYMQAYREESNQFKAAGAQDKPHRESVSDREAASMKTESMSVSWKAFFQRNSGIDGEPGGTSFNSKNKDIEISESLSGGALSVELKTEARILSENHISPMEECLRMMYFNWFLEEKLSREARVQAEAAGDDYFGAGEFGRFKFGTPEEAEVQPKKGGIKESNANKPNKKGGAGRVDSKATVDNSTTGVGSSGTGSKPVLVSDFIDHNMLSTLRQSKEKLIFDEEVENPRLAELYHNGMRLENIQPLRALRASLHTLEHKIRDAVSSGDTKSDTEAEEGFFARNKDMKKRAHMSGQSSSGSSKNEGASTAYYSPTSFPLKVAVTDADGKPTKRIQTIPLQNDPLITLLCPLLIPVHLGDFTKERFKKDNFFRRRPTAEIGRLGWGIVIAGLSIFGSGYSSYYWHHRLVTGKWAEIQKEIEKRQYEEKQEKLRREAGLV